MKHLATLFTLLLSCTMLAQGPVEFPWNPDSDGDDFIGVNDLMALLGEFDSVFSEENIYLSGDSLSAMYDAGLKNFLECRIACRNLPGRWSMPEFDDVILVDQDMWLDEEGYPNPESGVVYLQPPYVIDDVGMGTPARCFCTTKERPRVEYSYCLSGSGIGECADEKGAQGWIPQGGIHVTRDGIVSQAFWRWAE